MICSDNKKGTTFRLFLLLYEVFDVTSICLSNSGLSPNGG